MGEQKTTQTQSAYQPATATIAQGISELDKWYGNQGQHPVYSGRFTPSTSPLRTEALAGTEALGRNLAGQNFGQDYQTATQKYASYLKDRTPGVKTFADYDPSGVKDVVDTLVRPQTEEFQQRTLPGLFNQFDRTGAATNSRAGFGVANAGEQYARGISDTATQFGYKDFADTRDREIQLDQFLLSSLPQLLASGVSLADTPNKILDYVGQQGMGLEANEIQNALLENQYQRSVPFEDLSRYINSGIALGSTGGVTNTVQHSDPLASALQIAGGVGAAYLAQRPPGTPDNKVPPTGGNTSIPGPTNQNDLSQPFKFTWPF